MADDLIQQATANAPVVGAGGIAGAGGVIAALKFFKMFASPQDVDLVEARTDAKIATLEARFASTYVTQDMMKTVMDKLDAIQHRIDQLFDRK